MSTIKDIDINITLPDGEWTCKAGTWLKFKTPLKEYLGRLFWSTDSKFMIHHVKYTEESFLSYLTGNNLDCIFETDEQIPLDEAAYLVASPYEGDTTDGFLLLSRSENGWFWRIADDGGLVYEKGHIGDANLSLVSAREQVLCDFDLLDWILYPRSYEVMNERVLDDYY